MKVLVAEAQSDELHFQLFVDVIFQMYNMQAVLI